MKQDIHQRVTNQIIEALERGTRDLVMPWHRVTEFPTNAATQAPYQGINILNLWVAADQNSFGSHHWASFKQWQGLGAQVRRGSKGSVIVYYRQMEREAVDKETGEITEETLYIARYSTVFNADQVDGWKCPAVVTKGGASALERLASVERFVAGTQAHIQHGGQRAFYRPADDTIHMPATRLFRATPGSTASQSYYAVLLHELTHWTSQPQRCDREISRERKKYAFEELVAELGAAMLCVELGVTNEPREDHAAYLNSWLAVLREDKKAIFRASSLAQHAIIFLRNCQTKTAGGSGWII